MFKVFELDVDSLINNVSNDMEIPKKNSLLFWTLAVTSRHILLDFYKDFNRRVIVLLI